MKDPEKKTTHHHGNLREALVQAGVELLEDGGLNALTLRKCAARAGVSHAAPAHHFDGLHGLKAAIAIEGFRRFADFMRTEIAQSDQTPRGRLRAICRGYLQFGIEHQALLNLIFGLSADVAQKYDMEGYGRAAHQVLEEACAPFVPKGTSAAAVEMQVWSLIHGFTMLYTIGQFGLPIPQRIEDGPFDQVMALLDRLECTPT